VETGANNLLADYSVDFQTFLEAVKLKGLLLRGNINPAIVACGTREEIREAARTLLEKGKSYPRFIMGTGVIPYTTPQENVLVLRQVVSENIF